MRRKNHPEWASEHFRRRAYGPWMRKGEMPSNYAPITPRNESMQDAFEKALGKSQNGKA